MIDTLYLQTGVPIPLTDPKIEIYQPTIEDITKIGYNTFYQSSLLFCYPEKIAEQLHQQIPPVTMLSACFEAQDPSMALVKEQLDTFMKLIFQGYEIRRQQQGFILLRQGSNPAMISDYNFEAVKSTLVDCLMLDTQTGKQFNPSGPLAKEYADKIRKGREKMAKIRGQGNKKEENPLGYYISILAAGNGKDKNSLKKYTIPQLVDEYKRFSLKESFDIYIKRATSFGGVKKSEKVPQWTGSLDDNDD